MTATTHGHGRIVGLLRKTSDGPAHPGTEGAYPRDPYPTLDVAEVIEPPVSAGPERNPDDTGTAPPAKYELVPEWARSVEGIRRNVAHRAAVRLNNAIYWGIRRGYALLPAWWAIRGAHRLAGELVSYAFDLETREMRRKAAKAGDGRARAYERKELYRTRWTRFGGTAAWVGAGAGVAMTVIGPTVPLWVRVPVAVAVFVELALHGRPRPDERGPSADRLPHQDPDPAKTIVDSDRIARAFASERVKIVGAMTVGGMHLRPKDPPGWEGVIELPESITASMVLAKREELASALKVHESRLVLDRAGHAGQVRLTLFHRDPMTEDPVRSPLIEVPQVSLWDPVPIGTTIYGDPYGLVLPGTSGTWICSAPGYGKTNLLQIFLAAAALSGTQVRVLIHDGKGEGDLEVYAGIADHFSQGSDDAAGRACAAMLGKVLKLREDRAAVIRQVRSERPDLMPSSQITRAVTESPDWDLPLIVVVVDELNLMAETGSGSDIQSRVKTIAQGGRSGGLVPILAGQRFTDEVLGGAQSSMGTRVAFKTNSPSDSNSVLGSGQVGEGFNTSRWPDNYQGVCIVRPGGVQVHTGTQQVKTHLALFEDHRQIAARARRLRGGAPAPAGDRVKAEALSKLEPGENVVELAVLADRLGSSPEALRERLEVAGVLLKPSSRHGGRLCVRRAQLTDGA